MDNDSEQSPWYRDSRLVEPPFQLVKCFKNLRGPPYRFISLFPWNLGSLQSLGELYSDHLSNEWPKFVQTYAGLTVIGNAEELYLVSSVSSSGKQKKQIRLDTKAGPITAVAWALNGGSPLEPLLVIALSSIVCVYSVRLGEPTSFLRGHGGSITSIAVHPRVPFYVCTTSSDQTARIYDLDRFPDDANPFANPFWNPGTGPSKGGAPHGLRPSERTEWGRGQCTTILAGGRSGGHFAAVTCAAFHPTFPLIATGGMDRVVKIWRVHGFKGVLNREDKPLYSSTLVHRSSVASIAWLAEDTLFTHCTSTEFSSQRVVPPTEQSIEGEEELEWIGSPGRIVILRWLGLNRFFPPGETRHQEVQRGCVADYQESSSFTVIASIPLPYYPHTPHLNVFGEVYHDHIILVTHGRSIRLLNASHVPHLEATEFPTDDEQFPTAFVAQTRLRAEETTDAKWLRKNEWVDSLGWTIDLDPKFAGGESIQAVDMGLNGGMIAAVGSNGGMWVWMKSM
ncbi:WD40-repeat-containing domain protein [Lactarius pseudohatsudake]|nr:WD40-repeat-containing domain protein [Lactarius pseudohatsudake]